jgi:TldD protein
MKLTQSSQTPGSPEGSRVTCLDPVLEEWGLQEANLREVLSVALRFGGEISELFFEDTRSTRLFFENGRVDQVLIGRDRGVGLRILQRSGKSLYGYTTDLSPRAMLQLAQDLSAALSQPEATSKQDLELPSDWQWNLASSQWQSQPVSESEKSSRPAAKVSLGEKLELLKRADRAARQSLPEAKQVSVVFLDTDRKILVINSDASAAQDRKTLLQMVVQVVAQQGERVESAYESDGGWVGLEFFDSQTPESFGEKAARRVQTLLRACPAPSGEMPVVIAGEAGGTMIHEAVGHGLEADLACEGLSVYQNRIGQQVASPLISVVDDGTLQRKRGSYRFDDEGNPSQKTVLIEKGILKGYLVDRLSGLKFDLSRTGNGRRESFRHLPIVRMTNTYIEPGQDDPAEILGSTEWGVFVKAMGGGQVNTVTGDFVFAVTEGYLIEGGKLGAPIRGATLVGNGPQVLLSVDRVGSDLGFATGTCGKEGQGAPVTDAQPTLRIPRLTVGGLVPMNQYWSKR